MWHHCQTSLPLVQQLARCVVVRQLKLRQMKTISREDLLHAVRDELVARERQAGLSECHIRDLMPLDQVYSCI